ncbi:keratin, type I cytoskeletal 19-like [Rana temporaria]|uniref:keratin, type I cytoskeletal 19-like n=1 Tax=Rana temporaria TaxID=8407 RepID=UPI001AAD5BDE|nr:keratin, type I cytoskeletal 19-like [Rana temporaria]
MNYNLKKAWSTTGSLKRTSSFGGQPKKLFRHLSLASNKSSPESISFYGGSRLRRTFESGTIERSLGFNINSFESYDGWKNGGLFSINSKVTMMSLNDRLETYLEKVTSLKEENQQLERKIKEWYEKNAPQQLPDYSKNLKRIEELQREIFDARIDNTQVLLHIDNARLAGDDLQSKYNMELSLRQAIETDVVDLRRHLDGLTLERCDLEFQLEHLAEDLMLLKKNHNEEVNNLEEQLGARVHVELDMAPAVDLQKNLLDIRNEYESLMDRNLNDVEKWFFTQSEELNSRIVSGAEQLQTVKSEAIDLRHTTQHLEIDLQAQLSTISALEGTMAETEESYSSKLAEIQELINNIEADLAQMRYDLERQNNEYKILTNVKTCLEMEIATYKELIEGEDLHNTKLQSTGSRGLKIVSITEDIQDGKVISIFEKVHHLQI